MKVYVSRADQGTLFRNHVDQGMITSFGVKPKNCEGFWSLASWSVGKKCNQNNSITVWILFLFVLVSEDRKGIKCIRRFEDCKLQTRARRLWVSIAEGPNHLIFHMKLCIEMRTMQWKVASCICNLIRDSKYSWKFLLKGWQTLRARRIIRWISCWPFLLALLFVASTALYYVRLP